MPWNSNTNRMTAPVSIADIQAAVDGSSDDIGGLINTACNVDKTVNKWARYKPVEFNTMLPLTEANRIAAHHGFTVTAGAVSGSVMAMDIPGIYERYGLNGGDYPYSGPTTWYRFSDFINPDYDPNVVGSISGYGKDVPAPFTYNKPSSTSSSLRHYTVTVSMLYNSQSEITFGEIFSGQAMMMPLNDKYVCLLTRRLTYNNNYEYSLYRVKKRGTTTEVNLETLTIGDTLDVDVTFTVGETYDCMFVATEIEPATVLESTAGATMYFPGSGFTLSLTREGVGIPYTLSWSSNTVPSAYSSNNKVYVDFSQSLMLLNMTPSSSYDFSGGMFKLRANPLVIGTNSQLIDCGVVDLTEEMAISTYTSDIEDLSSIEDFQLFRKDNGDAITPSDVVGGIRLHTYAEVTTNSNLYYIYLYTQNELINTLTL